MAIRRAAAEFERKRPREYASRWISWRVSKGPGVGGEVPGYIMPGSGDINIRCCCCRARKDAGIGDITGVVAKPFGKGGIGLGWRETGLGLAG